MKIWIVVEEIESGSFADGTTYCVLSAHETKADAKAAVRAYGKDHGKVDEDGWNEDGTRAAVHEVELEKKEKKGVPEHLASPPPRHLYATAWGGADQTETGEPTTLCGLVKATVWTVHSSKARKTDCADCRRIFRQRIMDARKVNSVEDAEVRAAIAGAAVEADTHSSDREPVK
jgi:hypothetical protein